MIGMSLRVITCILFACANGCSITPFCHVYSQGCGDDTDRVCCTTGWNVDCCCLLSTLTVSPMVSTSVNSVQSSPSSFVSDSVTHDVDSFPSLSVPDTFSVTPETYLDFRTKSGDVDTLAIKVNELPTMRATGNSTETIVQMAPQVFVAVIASAIIATVLLAAVLSYCLWAHAPFRRVLIARMRRELRMRYSPPPSYEVSPV